MVSGAKMVAEIEICPDCALLVSNGELVDSDGNDITESHARKIVNEWGGVMIVVTGDDQSFSHTACGGCGDVLAGDRIAAVVWE